MMTMTMTMTMIATIIKASKVIECPENYLIRYR
jgi:hypothetical protein